MVLFFLQSGALPVLSAGVLERRVATMDTGRPSATILPTCIPTCTLCRRLDGGGRRGFTVFNTPIGLIPIYEAELEVRAARGLAVTGKCDPAMDGSTPIGLKSGLIDMRRLPVLLAGLVPNSRAELEARAARARFVAVLESGLAVTGKGGPAIGLKTGLIDMRRLPVLLAVTGKCDPAMDGSVAAGFCRRRTTKTKTAAASAKSRDTAMATATPASPASSLSEDEELSTASAGAEVGVLASGGDDGRADGDDDGATDGDGVVGAEVGENVSPDAVGRVVDGVADGSAVGVAVVGGAVTVGSGPIGGPNPQPSQVPSGCSHQCADFISSGPSLHSHRRAMR